MIRLDDLEKMSVDELRQLSERTMIPEPAGLTEDISRKLNLMAFVEDDDKDLTAVRHSVRWIGYVAACICVTATLAIGLGKKDSSEFNVPDTFSDPAEAYAFIMESFNELDRNLDSMN